MSSGWQLLTRLCPHARSWLALGITLLLIPAPPLPGAPQAPPMTLMIEIVEGDGAINNVKLRTSREAIVQVEDENHKPVAGATVQFFLSSRGLANPFSHRYLQATTDSTGRVRANLLQLKSDPGRLEVRVKANYQGRTATQTLHQTNTIQTANAGGAGNAGAASASTSTGAAAGAAPAAGTAAVAVGVAAVPATGAALTIGAIVVVGAAAAGATVGGLAATGAIGGGGGKSATVSVGQPHF